MSLSDHQLTTNPKLTDATARYRHRNYGQAGFAASSAVTTRVTQRRLTAHARAILRTRNKA